MPSHNLHRAATRALVALAACLAAAPAPAQRGAITAPRNIEQMVAGSSQILRGTVVSARVEKHPQLTHLDTIVVTLRVLDPIKGAVGPTYTFRQYIWDVRDRADAAGYYKGQEFILLMNAPSRYGLTSPVGMEQGRFRVTHDAAGKAVATNGRGNVQLMRGVSDKLARTGTAVSPAAASLVQKHQRGPIAADELVRLIRDIARSEG
jgi:hypothetical protein